MYIFTGFVPRVGHLRDKMVSRVFRKLGCPYMHLEPIDFDSNLALASRLPVIFCHCPLKNGCVEAAKRSRMVYFVRFCVPRC